MIKTKLDLISEMVSQTMTLCSALDAEDMEAVEFIIEEREKQIELLEKSSDPLADQIPEYERLCEVYMNYHESSVKKLKKISENMQVLISQNKAEQMNLKKVQKLKDKYISSEESSGRILDTLK